MPEKLPIKKNIRLKEYDYSQAVYYFITICAKDDKNLLGTVGAATCRPQTADDADFYQINVELTNMGKIVDDSINNIPKIYSNILVDKYVIMPNHVHMIIIITAKDENHSDSGRQIAAPTIQTVIGGLKRHVSMQCECSFWQKSFHDHIIRDEKDYLRIWQYIDENPAKWAEDKYYR